MESLSTSPIRVMVPSKANPTLAPRDLHLHAANDGAIEDGSVRRSRSGLVSRCGSIDPQVLESAFIAEFNADRIGHRP